MIDAKQLLDDLKKLARKLEADVRQRCAEQPEVDEPLRKEYVAARNAGRTASTYETWREERIAQAAAAWILGCVFVRFLEDNDLVAPAMIAGPGERLKESGERRTDYFRRNPTHSDREYLESVFREVAKLPGVKALFDERHNPLWRLGVSGYGATDLIEFWREVDPATGALRRDFTDEEWNTRFLGDLYQDVSEDVRKRYALLQTPEFVEEFILERTLTPAIAEFGYREVRLIDPACGSGHFLLGAFRRLCDVIRASEPGTNPVEQARRAIDAVHGVDVNPYAASIARFRLLIAALKESGVTTLKDAFEFPIHVATGDSLLHGVKGQMQMAWSPIAHVYETEDREQLERILRPGHYHAVVGNPPYITPKDSALNAAYRKHFGSCYRQYSLAVPFMERMFDLAVDGGRAGYVGMITANSFMKREFGKRLIEQFIPHWDLTHVVNTSGAHIPGHDTPTVILFGRHRAPVGETVRGVLGIKGELSAPEDAAKGLVWTSIVTLVDRPGESSEFVSVADMLREGFHKHPWSIGGGGVAELKELIEASANTALSDVVSSIGFFQDTHADEAFVQPHAFPKRFRLAHAFRDHIRGDEVRDWAADGAEMILFPYDEQLDQWPEIENNSQWRWLYRLRTVLWSRSTFGGDTYNQVGRPWYDFHQFPKERARTPLSIAFGFVATHNHFVLDRGGRVFNRSAPVIKLPEGSTEDDHLALLGLLNSSIACFWMKQVSHDKGIRGIAGGFTSEAWERFFEFTATGLQQFPVPFDTPLSLTRRINELCQRRSEATRDLVSQTVQQPQQQPDENLFALQEDLDWRCYRLYDLIDDDLTMRDDNPPPINLGERAFEIVMARKIAAGELETAWFERHGSTPITEIPAHWPDNYKQLVERRIKAIESNANINLIERPEYKRRWNIEPWEVQQERALREWLLDRLETPAYWPDVEITGTTRLADRASRDKEFMRIAEIYRGRPDFDVATLVAELAEAEAVPFLPVLRYKESGLRKRREWEHVWDLQRQEDAIDARTALPEDDPQRITKDQAEALKKSEIGSIPVPPKYASADFKSSTFWRLRGKLDVPKERFVSYPGCARDADSSLPLAWAGWDHRQQATALASYYQHVKDEGWSTKRLLPLLAGLAELLPWLKLWHNEPDPEFGGLKMGDYFESFVAEQARAAGKTLDEIREWTSAEDTRRGRRARG
jgi:hypothetical protein